MVNPLMSILDLTVEAGIPGRVMSLIDDQHIVYVPYHDGLLVNRVNVGMDEEIDRMAVAFAMQMKKVTLAELA